MDALTGIVAFHGTSAGEFSEFATAAEGAHFGTSKQAAARLSQRLGSGGPPRIIAAYLDIRAPLRLPDLGVWSNFNIVFRHLSVNGHITQIQADEVWSAWMTSDAEGWRAVKGALAQQGFDGIVYANEVEGHGDSYIVFSARQVTPIPNFDSIEPLGEDPFGMR